MPQLSPLYWMVSSIMVMFMLMSMVMVFYMKNTNLSKLNKCNVNLMIWCW
uniref:ATP synthase F0 subunit 8 n=1 Tax=Austrarchaea raveni TaxID=1028703 RepID=H2E3Y1_9ARAC|nr:ATP synthase F0 subunit 8 [Austrarchaea raveni]AEX88896.1 ATP synthase F0 subunit 8 [Austrarchaea raveni]AEX88899.1 ATP synthase F0 subunit 8 [Austrarchaea raveni]